MRIDLQSHQWPFEKQNDPIGMTAQMQRARQRVVRGD